jgi:hypothetical protein
MRVPDEVLAALRTSVELRGLPLNQTIVIALVQQLRADGFLPADYELQEPRPTGRPKKGEG